MNAALAGINGLLSVIPKKFLVLNGIPEAKISLLAESLTEMWLGASLALGIVAYSLPRVSFEQSVGFALLACFLADIRFVLFSCNKIGVPKAPVAAWAALEILAAILALNKGFDRVSVNLVARTVGSAYILQGLGGILFTKATFQAYGSRNPPTH